MEWQTFSASTPRGEEIGVGLYDGDDCYVDLIVRGADVDRELLCQILNAAQFRF